MSFSVMQNIGASLGKANRLSGNLLDSLLQQKGLTGSKEQWVLLSILLHRDGSTLKQLSEMTFKNKASITSLVKNLSKQGLVEKRLNPQDSRSSFVFITAAGKQLHSEMIPAVEEALHKMMHNIDQQELQTCQKVLDQITFNLL